MIIRQIRSSVFETNSSSTHVLCLTPDSIKAKQDVVSFDNEWDFYRIERILQAGEYEELSEEIKEHLNDIGFKLEKLLEDEEYFYEFIDSFNSGSGEGGYFDIDLSFIDRIYDDYNLHFPISKDDFYKLISEDIDLKNVLSVDVDWNRNHTIDYLRENYRVISKNSEIGLKLEQILDRIDRIEHLEYYKKEIKERGIEQVKIALMNEIVNYFYVYKDEDRESKLKEHIEAYYKNMELHFPETYEYLKEQKIID